MYIVVHQQDVQGKYLVNVKHYLSLKLTIYTAAVESNIFMA